VACNFRAEGRDQLRLLPVSVAEWLPEDHLAYFVLDAVAEMDLSAFYAGYREDGWGGAARHPRTMVALLLYAYCLGVRWSRQVERACLVDVAFRVICANVGPDHTRIGPVSAASRTGAQDAVHRVAAAVRRGGHDRCGPGCLGRHEDGRQRLHAQHRRHRAVPHHFRFGRG
jgi:hypothetical protein